MNSIRFYFITPVWGEKFVDMFLHISLPTQLSKGNLGSFQRRPNADKYKIYTTSKDAGVIQKSPVCARLNELIETEFHFIDDALVEFETGKINKYDLMTICHGRGIADGLTDHAALVILSADVVFSDGSFANIRKIAQSGKRGIAIGSYRVVTETFGSALQKKFYSSKRHCITIPSREMVKLSLDCIHPDSRVLFWDEPSFLNGWPAFLYWDVSKEGVLQRGIHLHPLMIYPSRKDVQLNPSSGMGIDGYDYIKRVVPDFEDIYVVEDSDEIASFSLQHASETCCSPYPANMFAISSWIRKHCCSYHINYLKRKIRFHCAEISPQWEKVEQASDKVVESICACVELLDKVPDIQKELEARDERLQNLDYLVQNLALEDAIAHNRLGMELCKSDQLDEAEAVLQRALELAPNLADAHSNLAVLYGDQRGDLVKGIKYIKKALELAPQNADMWLILIEFLHKSGLSSQAIKCLKQAASLPSDDVEILSTLGNRAIKLSDFDVVRIALNRLKMIDPTHIMVQVMQQALVDATMSRKNRFGVPMEPAS